MVTSFVKIGGVEVAVRKLAGLLDANQIVELLAHAGNAGTTRPRIEAAVPATLNEMHPALHAVVSNLVEGLGVGLAGCHSIFNRNSLSVERAQCRLKLVKMVDTLADELSYVAIDRGQDMTPDKQANDEYLVHIKNMIADANELVLYCI